MKKQLIKVGSNALMNGCKLDDSVISNIVEGIAYGFSRDISSVLVTSGAVALGREYLGKRELAGVDELTFKQIYSGAGQALLMEKYITEFAKYKIKVAQILVTQDTFANKKSMASLMQVIQGYIDLGIVPIINENDVLSTEELVFSDNDVLAKMIALSLRVERVIFLSNVEGLNDTLGKVVPEVTQVDDDILVMVDEAISTAGKGGMMSKIIVAKALMEEGIPLHLAHGKREGVIKSITDGEQVGTVFKAQIQKKK